MSQFQNLEKMLVSGVGEYGFPEIKGTQVAPNMDSWIEFDYAKRTAKNRSSTGIHFFEYDYKFVRVWESPDRYIELLSQFGCVLSTDFSMYRDFPKAIQIYNKYRNHWLAAYWQSLGITVIPQIGWSTPDNFDWQFEGYPKHSVVAVSSVGCKKELEARRLFELGWQEMLKRLEPSEILLFAKNFSEKFDGPVHYIRYNIDKECQR